MTDKKFKEELKFLDKYNMSENEKIELIEKFYRLSHINFNLFKINGQIELNK